VSIVSSVVDYLRSAPQGEPGRRQRPAVKPAGVVWGVDERPTAVVLWVSALQHVLLATVTTAFPLLVFEAAGAPHEIVRQVLSASLFATGICSLLLSMRGRDLGAGALMPAGFSGVFFTVSVVAAKQGGLPLVAGMTFFGGVVQFLLARSIHRLRPYLPTEIAGFAMLMSGLTLGIVGFNLLTGVSAAGDVMKHDLEASAVLGVVCVLAMIGLFVWGAGRIRLYVVLIVFAVGYTIGGFLGLVPFSQAHLSEIVPHAPLPVSGWPTFAFNLIIPFAVASIASSLRAIGDFSTVQKINDANWQRPDMKSIQRGLTANSFGMMFGGLMGSVAISTSSASVGLTLTTGVNSRVVGYAAGAVFIALSFVPAAQEFIILAPSGVLGSALVFTSCFIIVNGMQAMVSRLMDGRRTLVVAFALLLAVTRYLFPGFYADAPNWLQPVVGSPMAIGMLAALSLNALFRIGIKKSWSMDFTPGVDSLDTLEQFADKQGGIWGARRDVIQRVARALIETAEALDVLIAPGTQAHITMSFDEYWLEVTTEYHGKPLVTGGAVPSPDELLADQTQLTRLAAVMIRRLATRLTTTADGDRQRIRLGFEH
jgi:xanthine permease XanP